jgi:hypothetical protein
MLIEARRMCVPQALYYHLRGLPPAIFEARISELYRRYRVPRSPAAVSPSDDLSPVHRPPAGFECFAHRCPSAPSRPTAIPATIPASTPTEPMAPMELGLAANERGIGNSNATALLLPEEEAWWRCASYGINRRRLQALPEEDSLSAKRRLRGGRTSGTQLSSESSSGEAMGKPGKEAKGLSERPARSGRDSKGRNSGSRSSSAGSKSRARAERSGAFASDGGPPLSAREHHPVLVEPGVDFTALLKPRGKPAPPPLKRPWLTALPPPPQEALVLAGDEGEERPGVDVDRAGLARSRGGRLPVRKNAKSSHEAEGGNGDMNGEPAGTEGAGVKSRRERACY